MHHTFMHAYTPSPKIMVLAETSTFGIFPGQNVRGRNVLGRNVRGRNVRAPISIAQDNCSITAPKV